MAQAEKQIEVAEETSSFDPFDAPIPGASLTSDPKNRSPFEQPPQFTDPQAAVEEIFFRMTEDKNNLHNILDLMRDNIPVEDITQTLLFRGFTEGKWTPDLILQLIEPTIYILLNLAEYAGIEATLYPEDDMDEEDAFETSDDRASGLRKIVAGETREALEEVEGGVSELPVPAVVPKSLRERLQEVSIETEDQADLDEIEENLNV